MTLSSMKTAAARTLTEMNNIKSRKPHLTLARSETHDPLRNCVRRSLADYFNQLEGEPVTQPHLLSPPPLLIPLAARPPLPPLLPEGEPVSELYQMVLAEMEIPLLEKVLEYPRGNQTKAAELLGLNRGTLRKKLKQYGLL